VNTQARSVIIATLNTAPSWPVNGIISQSLLLIKLQLKMMHHSKKNQQIQQQTAQVADS